jgi:hypothetical protein
MVAMSALTLGNQISAQSALAELLDRASRYVLDYESSFWLLAMDEEYVQWIERPINPGANLSRTNPGGGAGYGGPLRKRIIKSDFLLVQLGAGRGWMPFRDILTMDGHEIRAHDDRLVRLFRSSNPEAFDLAAKIHDEGKQYDMGQVSRTINIPMLGMMLLHPEVRGRFTFQHGPDESINGRVVERLSYRETRRPTLTRTSRGRDLALTGRIWIESTTGVVVKTEVIAADPIVRAQVTVTYRRDAELGMWLPEKMEEYYKANLALDDIFATSAFSTPRVFQTAER